MVWVPAQLVNFSVVPMHLRIPFGESWEEVQGLLTGSWEVLVQGQLIGLHAGRMYSGCGPGLGVHRGKRVRATVMPCLHVLAKIGHLSTL